MPVLNHCPNCSRPLRVPDELIGRNVKCPDCGTTFQSTAEGGQAAPLPVSRPAADLLPNPADGSLWDRSRAAGKVTGPAIGLLALSSVWIVMLGLVLAVVMHWRNDPQELAKVREEAKRGQGRQLSDEEKQRIDGIFDAMTSPEYVAYLSTVIFLNAVIFVGAIQMLRLRTRPLAIAAGVLACIPLLASPCCFIGIPFGLWALVGLFQPEVRDAFGPPSVQDYPHDSETD